MNAQQIQNIPDRDTHPIDVSPALETGSPTPLSTHWIPLHELITHWTEVDPLLVPAPVAPLLSAIGHALFALSRETRALRLYTLAWEKRRWNAPPREMNNRYHQAVRHLHEAAHHWSRAAFSLDSLLPGDLDPTAFARAGHLSRIARTQQARLWALIEEVCADREALRDQMETDQQQRIRCQRGEHDLLATASPGVVVCRLCRTLGVCLWCGLTLPHGACVVVCAKHVGAVRRQGRRTCTVEARTLQTKETPHEP